jgi:hypothetical protein
MYHSAPANSIPITNAANAMQMTAVVSSPLTRTAELQGSFNKLPAATNLAVTVDAILPGSVPSSG